MSRCNFYHTGSKLFINITVCNNRDFFSCNRKFYLFANKILYYPDEERTIAVGNVHATVYPGSDSGKKDKDKDKDKKKDKKKKKKKAKKTEDDEFDVEEADIEENLQDVPAGDFTEIGGDNSDE